MQCSVADGEAAPAASGVFLQHVGLMGCLLPYSSTCLAPSVLDATGVLMASGFSRAGTKLETEQGETLQPLMQPKVTTALL